ncbi:MAG TPA: RidA family protein [Prosthecochloris aestuarii]|uniref:RidA family protein n=1 Tax=Prosthecochloris aestuarii TaxID=1102 RepID=A0A831SR39_PROAE|nr:RidA family protein [Prosthecochloris sp.]HED31366.1 RidA family protein [Prosthecochloris aestuarii]
MSLVEERLKKAGIILPEPAQPAGIYRSAVKYGNLVFTSGQLPLVNGVLCRPGGTGKVNEINQQDAADAARIALLNALAAVKSVAGSLDSVEQIVRMTVYVASEAFFSRQHIVANAASAVLYEAFAEKGRHARSAVGVAELPMDASVEIELIAGLR